MAARHSRVTLFRRRIENINDAQLRALEKTAEAVHTEVVQAQVMPRDTGALQNEKTFVDDSNINQGKVKIVSEGPYARRLYYHPEYNFQKDENPDAGGKWFRNWLPGGSQEHFAREAFAEFMRREL